MRQGKKDISLIERTTARGREANCTVYGRVFYISLYLSPAEALTLSL
jgi:hypothetical protein